MNNDLLKGLLIGGVLVMTLPLFYLLFTKVILPTLWQESESNKPPVSAIETSTHPLKDTSVYERFT